MDARCRIEMLGGLRVHQGARVITRFRTERTGALLAYLAYHLPQSHPREVLAETIWPGQTPRAGRNSLNTALSSLRRQFEPPGVPAGAVLQTDRFSAQMNPAVVATDVKGFEAALRSAAGADSAAQRRQHLEAAAALYRGELLPGFYDDWVLVEQQRLADQYFEAALKLAALLQRSGEFERAVEVVREAIARDPLREEAHGELMRLYALSGEPVAALRQYGELKTRLAEELGQAPSPATEELARRIRAGSPGVAGPGAPAEPGAARLRFELPTGTVTFLLTDIEGSTALFERLGEAFREVLEAHHALLRREFRRHGSEEVRQAGDGFIVPFPSASDAVECAVACQQALAHHHWSKAVGTLRVRMALYTGDVRPAEGDYREVVLHRASRVLSAAHGGQILCSEVTAALLKRDLRQDVQLADLGTYRLRDVAMPEKLFQVNYAGMAARKFPPPRAEAGYAGNLPLRLTRFFGREAELARLTDLVRSPDTRLVVLTGPGGSGKTRLAVEAARHLLDAFQGAVWFATLQELTSAAGIPGAIIEALQLPPSPQVEPLDQAVAALSAQPSLLVLDNLEHLLDEGAPIVRTLLERAPTLKSVVTSRELLNLDGEAELLVASLPVPQGDEGLEGLAGCPSVQLFVDRAQAVRPDFQLTQANAPAVTELCARLEGIPLALELAAARTQVLTPAQMVAQLERRFEFLVSRKRDLPERHRTLRAAIDWSYQSLPPDLQRFFCRLSVFRGGWTIEAAEAVCEDPNALDNLERLCERSMVLPDAAAEHAGTTRFRLLETLREFGSERLSDDETLRLKDRHVSCLLGFATGRAAKASGPDDVQVHRELEAEIENIRAALEWSSSRGQHQEFAELIASCGEFLWRRGYWAELAEGLGAALRWVRASARTDRQLEMTLLRLQAQLQADRGELESAGAACQAGLALARESAAGEIEGALLNILGLVRRKAQDPPGAQRAFEESLALFRSLGDRRGEGLAMHNLALLAQDAGEVDAARRLYEEALPLRRASGDLRGAGEVENNLGFLAEAEGRWDLAAERYRAALAQLLQVGDILDIAVVLSNLGEAWLRMGDVARAVELLGPARRALAGMGSAHALHTAALFAEAGGSPSAQVTQGPWRRVLLEVASDAAGMQSR